MTRVMGKLAPIPTRLWGEVRTVTCLTPQRFKGSSGESAIKHPKYLHDLLHLPSILCNIKTSRNKSTLFNTQSHACYCFYVNFNAIDMQYTNMKWTYLQVIKGFKADNGKSIYNILVKSTSIIFPACGVCTSAFLYETHRRDRRLHQRSQVVYCTQSAV